MISDLIKPHIQKLHPYQSARDIYKDVSGILLDANENSFGSVAGDSVSLMNLNRYPDPHQIKLRKALSDYIKVDAEKLFFGVGSDEIIDLLMRLFCSHGKDSVMIVEPTYGMYTTVANIQNIEINSVLLDENFGLNAGKVLSNVSGSDRIIFLCSPNNPTGNLLNKNEISLIAEKFKGIVVVDEAYIDFADDDASAVSLINEYKNIVILRTFSKAWGLAAVRCGYAIADEVITSYLFKIKAPYSINVMTEQIILKALSKFEEKNKFVELIVKERDFLITELSKIVFVKNIFPSDANYILIKLDFAKEVQKMMMHRGVIIRDRSTQPLLEDCLRITVGTRAENIKMIEKMIEVYNEISGGQNA